MRCHRVTGTVATVFVGLASLSGCASATPQDSCIEMGSALSTASTGAANAFASVDHDPAAAIMQLKGAQADFSATRDGWAPEIHAAGGEFVDAMGALIAATETATSPAEIDADALRAAVADFEAAAVGAAEMCSTPSPASTE